MLKKCEEGTKLKIKFGEKEKKVLAFYKGIVFSVTQNIKHDGTVDGYRITHISTGMAVGNKISNRDTAKTLAGMLEDIYYDSSAFRTEDPKTLHGTELKDVTAVARAVAKLIGTELTGSYSTQELAEKVAETLTNL